MSDLLQTMMLSEIIGTEKAKQESDEKSIYSQDDLKNWEFKIIRSLSPIFNNPSTLKKILEEEAQAGWILLEKIDNYRLRLKRPMDSRKNDSNLVIDPYRTTIGRSLLFYVLRTFIIFVALCIAFIFLLTKS